MGLYNMDNNCFNAIVNLTFFPKHAISLTYHTRTKITVLDWPLIKKGNKAVSM